MEDKTISIQLRPKEANLINIIRASFKSRIVIDISETGEIGHAELNKNITEEVQRLTHQGQIREATEPKGLTG